MSSLERLTEEISPSEIFQAQSSRRKSSRRSLLLPCEFPPSSPVCYSSPKVTIRRSCRSMLEPSGSPQEEIRSDPIEPTTSPTAAPKEEERVSTPEKPAVVPSPKPTLRVLERPELPPLPQSEEEVYANYINELAAWPKFLSQCEALRIHEVMNSIPSHSELAADPVLAHFKDVLAPQPGSFLSEGVPQILDDIRSTYRSSMCNLVRISRSTRARQMRIDAARLKLNASRRRRMHSRLPVTALPSNRIFKIFLNVTPES